MIRHLSAFPSSWRIASHRSFRRTLLQACLLWSLGGCRQILGIDQAELDPGGASSSAGSSGGGGTASTENGGGESSGGSGDTGDAGSHASDADGGTSASGGTDPGSGATGAMTSGGEAGAGGGEEPPPQTLCEAYCATVTTNCSGGHAQYADLGTCLSVCAALPAGELGDSDVNTVHCRLAEAKKAAGGEPDFYCPFAGPGGGGGCGDDCEGYCSLMMSLCTSENTGGLYYFQNAGVCKQTCKDLPVDVAPYNPSLHSAGNHLQCRLFHACSAIADPDYHCGHALGEPPCQDITTP
jgi:hypothetical protein